jgi:hypothetical protein
MGRLEFNGMWPGEHGVRVAGDGYRQVHRRVVLVEGSVHEFEIVLEPGVAIAGVVHDENGKPLPAVRIEAVCKEPEPAGEQHEVPAASTTTDAEGRFVLGGLRRGRHEVTVSGPSAQLAEPLVVTAPAADVKVRLRRLAPVPPR